MISTVSRVYKIDRIPWKQADRSLNFRPTLLLQVFSFLALFLFFGFAIAHIPVGDNFRIPCQVGVNDPDYRNWPGSTTQATAINMNLFNFVLIQTNEVNLHFGSPSNRSPSPGLWPPSPLGRGAGGEREIVTKRTAFVLGSERQMPLRRFEFTEPIMGTTARIVLYAPDKQLALEASRTAFERMAALENMLSDYRPESELNQLCRNALESPKPVSPDLFEVLSESQALAENTRGAFDVTVGPVVQLWRRARRQKELPTPDRLAEARKFVGHQKLQLDFRSQSAQLLIPGMKLDLGGIAKGYAADQALRALQSKGVEMALVAIGGDIALGAPPPEKSGWRVEINPGPAFKAKPFRPLLLSHAGVSTSGDAEQFVEISGKRFSHIVDPRTGMALLGNRSATIVAINATASDALATALCVMGPKAGLRFIQSRPRTEALYLEVFDGKIRSYTSRKWVSLEARE